MNQELAKLVQLAIVDLQYKQIGNTTRDRWVHVSDIQKWVEARKPNTYAAEAITREVRRLKTEGLLERRASGLGLYTLKLR